MLHHKSLYLFALVAVVFTDSDGDAASDPDSDPQTYFGGVHQPAGAPYQPSAPAYQPPQVTYKQPHQPAYPRPRGPPVYGRNSCSINITNTEAEVCVPTFKTDCTKTKGTNGKRVVDEEKCQPVTRTVCSVTEHIDYDEVCPYLYVLEPAVAPATTAVVEWVQHCHDEPICVNPHTVVGGYGNPHHCTKEYITTCVLAPALTPITSTVNVQLPRPVARCIKHPITIPGIDCIEVKDYSCPLVPKIVEGEDIELDKCSVSLDQDCHNAVLQLPTQTCLSKVTEVKYVEQYAQPAYSG